MPASLAITTASVILVKLRTRMCFPASFEDVRRFQLRLAENGAHILILKHTVAALRYFFRVTLKRGFCPDQCPN
jgi:hypothetical protein